MGVLRRHVLPDSGRGHQEARGFGDDASDPSLEAAPCSTSTPSGPSSPSSFPPGFEPGRLLLNRRIIITGAGSGIGYAAALLFASQGARLVLCDLDGDKLQAAVDFIRNSGARRCVALSGDVTDDAYVSRVIDLAVETFGGIDDLVLNAGFTWDGTVHKMPDAQWQAMLDVHVTAPRKMIKAAAPHMRDAAKLEIEENGAAKPRSVLTVSSVSGVHGNAGQTNYAAAKAGVVGLTKALAKEWGPFNIRANAVVFGHIKTRLTDDKQKGATIAYRGLDVRLGIPAAGSVGDVMSQLTALGRPGLAEEAAGAMLLITSPYASYITGQAIEVTGGGWM
jgi:3-oxoacyl-[acyl-carrier protein] reductase